MPNKNLLLNPIRATRTKVKIKKDIDRGIFPIKTRQELHKIEYMDTNGKIVIRLVSSENEPDSNNSLNFNSGVLVQHCANTIMSKIDRHKARMYSN